MTQVHRLRTERGLSQQQVADQANVSAFTVWKMESGKYRFSYESASKVAHVFEEDIYMVFDRTELTAQPSYTGKTGSHNTRPIQIIPVCGSCGTMVSTAERDRGFSECCEMQLAS